MPSGSRVLGIAASDDEQTSVLAGAILRADRVLDGVGFETCTVGGRDATPAVQSLIDRLDRPDVAAVMIAGIAPAWFNLVDLPALDASGPVLSVSFEASPGLEAAIDRAFDGERRAWRRAVYDRQPPRRALEVGDDRVFVRSPTASIATQRDLLAASTPEGGRPEPVRVARLLARGAREWRRTEGF